MRDIAAIMAAGPVVPVIEIARVEDAVPLAKALVAGGVRVLEITLRTAAALDAIARIRAEVPDAIAGAGTVLNAQQVRLTLEAGAQFAVSPGLTPGIADACAQARLPLLPGVATASDIMLGLERGYHRFKFFPAESSGGVPALKAFAGPFGEVRFCPTGGINPENAKSYLSLSNVICVGGSWLAPRALVEGQDWAAITALARAATELRA